MTSFQGAIDEATLGGIPMRQRGAPLRLSNRGAIRWSGIRSMGQGGTGYTIGAVVQLPGDFLQVRGIHCNTLGSGVTAGGIINLGATASASFIYPVDASGNPATGFLGPKRVGYDQGGGFDTTGATSANAGSAITTATPGGITPTVTTLALPAAAGGANPTAYTDWAYTPSVARSDGGRGRLLSMIVDAPSSISGFVPGPSFTANPPGSPLFGQNSYYPDIGVTQYGGYYQGDYGTQLPVFDADLKGITAGTPGATGGLGALPFVGVEAIFARKVLTIAQVGDSMADLPGFGRYTAAQACAELMTAANPGVPVCSYCCGQYGQDTNSYVRNALMELARYPYIGAVFIHSESGNTTRDADPAGVQGAEKANVLALAAECERRGMMVFIVGPTCTLPTDSAANIALLTFEQGWAQSLPYPFINLFALWGGGGGIPAVYNPAMIGADTHPTPAATLMLGRVMAQALAPYVPVAFT